MKRPRMSKRQWRETRARDYARPPEFVVYNPEREYFFAVFDAFAYHHQAIQRHPVARPTILRQMRDQVEQNKMNRVTILKPLIETEGK